MGNQAAWKAEFPGSFYFCFKAKYFMKKLKNLFFIFFKISP